MSLANKQKGVQVDTTNLDLEDSQASDVVDSAAQLIIAIRDAVASGSDSIRSVYGELGELEEALVCSDVIGNGSVSNE
jgi:hypothetical protein